MIKSWGLLMYNRNLRAMKERFSSISLQNDRNNSFTTSTHFQIQIIKNGKSMGYTSPILCDPNQEGVISIADECLGFTTIFSETSFDKNNCEIRLFQIIPGGERSIGSYQFLLSNYIHASKDLHRSCVDMRVEIGLDFRIDYVVYLQSTRQALEKIVQEHETAKKLHMIEDWGSEQAEFLPEEIRSRDLEDEVKVIRYDMASPLIIHQRFWSPARLRHKKSLISQQESELNSPLGNRLRITRSEQKQQKRKKAFMKMKKNPSIISENTSNTMIKNRFVKKEKKMNKFIEEEVEKLADNQQNLIEDNEKLYEVIISNSKVIASPMGSDDEEENSNHMKVSELLHSSERQKRTNQSFKSVININLKVFYIAVSFLLIILIYLTINTDRPRSLKRPGKERKKKH